MSDGDGEKKPEKGSGSLRDDAAGASGRTAVKRSWGAVFGAAAEDAPSGSEDSASGPFSQAVEAVAEVRAREREVSVMAKLEETLSECLAPHEGDDEVLWKDHDGTEITKRTVRLLERIDRLAEVRDDLSTEEGEEGPNVKKLDEQILGLNALVPRNAGSMLEHDPGLFVAGLLEEKRKSNPPAHSEEEAGSELGDKGAGVPEEVVGKEGVTIGTDTWNDISGSPEALEEKGISAPVGLGKGRSEGAGLSETRLWAPAEEPAVSVGGDAAGSTENKEKKAHPVLGGVELTPIGPEDASLLNQLDKLDYVSLQEMALNRRLQADTNITTGTESGDTTKMEATEMLLAQADALEKESDRRNPNNAGGETPIGPAEAELLNAVYDNFVRDMMLIGAEVLENKERRMSPDSGRESVPGGTVIRASGGAEATGPVGAGEPRREKGKPGMETVVGIRPKRPVSRPPSSKTVIRKAGEPKKTSKPVGAGVPRDVPRKARAETVVGVQAGLSESGLFAGHDDAEMKQMNAEGSKADIIVDLMENGGQKKRGETSVRLNTGVISQDKGVSHVADEGDRFNGSVKFEDMPVLPTAEELAATRLSMPLPDMEAAPDTIREKPEKTAVTVPLGEYSKYGDIFYAMETVFMETGKIRDVGLREFSEHLEEAIELALDIAHDVEKARDIRESGVSPEMRRFQRLKGFHREFVEVPEGEERPKKDLEEYMLWREMHASAYDRIADVFDILGISPGEYSRGALLRICGMCLEREGLSAGDAKKVNALKLMLEAKQGENDVDEFEAERIADLNHEMVMGFATKKERELRKSQVDGILRMEAELRELKLKVSAFKQKEDQLVSILANLHENITETESREEGMAKYIPELKMALVELEPNYREREKYMKALYRAIKKEGELGDWLGKKAKEKLERKMIMVRRSAAERARETRKGSGVTRAAGIIGLPLVGAAILAAGMWLNQHGITLPSGNNVVDAQEDAAAEVASTETDTMPPAGVAEAADANVEEAVPEEGTAEAGTGMGGAGPEPEEEAEEEPGSVHEEVEAAAGKPGAEEDTGEPEEGEEAEAEGEFPRTPFGLKLALSEWSDIAKYHAVDNVMLRAAYASVEESIIKKAKEEGRRIPLPRDNFSWPRHMVRMKFKNPLYEIAVMSDMWRLKWKSIDPEVKYAAGMRLAAALGYRAGEDRKLPDQIRIWNKRIKWKNREKGTELPLIPELDKDSLLGKTESEQTRKGKYLPYEPWKSCCLVSSTLYDMVVGDLQKILEREKILSAEEAILDKLSSRKEVSEEKYQELAGEIEEIGRVFVTEGFNQKAIEVVVELAGEDTAAEIVGKINEDGIYKGLGDDLAAIEGLDKNEVEAAVGRIREIKADRNAKERSKAYIKRVLQAIEGRMEGEFGKKGTLKKFLKRMENTLERSVKERAREFMGKVRIALGSLDDWVFDKFKKAKFAANYPRKTKTLADACRVFTQNKKGRAGLGEAPGVSGEWRHNRNMKLRQEARRQAEAEKLTKDAFKDKEGHRKEKEKGDKLKEKGKKGKKSGSDRAENNKEMDNIEFIERHLDRQSQLREGAAKKKRSELFSYRGGIGTDKGAEAKRLAKKEAYMERFRVRMGVEDRKPSPFKRLASKLRMNKGLERATARA